MLENNLEQLSIDLRALADKRAELDIKSKTVPERMLTVIDTARANLDTKIDAILGDAVFIAAVETLESQLAEDTAQIEQLASDGLLSEEDQLTLITELVSGPSYDLLRLAHSLKGKVTLGESVDLVLVDETENSEDTTSTIDIVPSSIDNGERSEVDDSTEAITEKIPTTLTVIGYPDGKELKVGRTRGRRYKFSKSRDAQKDYTEERQKILELLISVNGSEVRVMDIQDMLEASGLDSSKQSLKQFRSWVNPIKFKGISLLETNDKRGLLSTYRINPKLDIKLQYKNVDTSINRTKSLDSSLSQTKNSKPEAQPTASVIDSISQSTIPLRESAVLLTFLKDNSDLLECLGIPIPNREMVENIDIASNEEDTKNGTNRTSLTPEKLEQERYDVARQFRALFSEENLFDDFIDLISSDSVLSPVVDYLSDIEDEQWDLLLQQVLKYRTSTTTIESSNGHAGTNPEKLITFIHLPNGALFKRTTIIEDNKTIFEVVNTKPEWKEDDTVDIQSDTSSTTIIDYSNTEINPNTSDENEIDSDSNQESSDSEVETHKAIQAPERKTRVTPQWENGLKEQARIEIEKLVDAGALFQGTKTVAQAIGLSTFETSAKKFIEDMLKAGIIEKQIGNNGYSTWEISAKHIIIAKLLKSNPRLAGQGSKKDQKQAVQIIESLVQSELDKLR